jgi:putative ATP-dependent endonuclease of OLD family
MKVSNVFVQNYRSLKHVELAVDDYTAFVGANGSGKSSVLYALQWFYEGGALEAEDICAYQAPADGDQLDESPDAIAARTVSVTVTFSDLTNPDRVRLREYGRGETATFRKTWTLGDTKPKVVGNAKQGPGFAEVRAMKLVGEFRPAYVALRSAQSGLPDLGASPAKDQVIAALATWEGNFANVGGLVDVNDSDANHMFGIDGPNIILKCSRLVLIPAAAEIANQVGSSGKGSALGDLIGAFMSNAGATARAAWQTRYATELAELNASVKKKC